MFLTFSVFFKFSRQCQRREFTADLLMRPGARKHLRVDTCNCLKKLLQVLFLTSKHWKRTTKYHQTISNRLVQKNSVKSNVGVQHIFFQNFISFLILTTERQKLTTKHNQMITKRFPRKNFINIKKWAASVKLAPQIWIIHNFLNFDHQTSKVDYQTPPNDHQTISYEKIGFFIVNMLTSWAFTKCLIKCFINL